MCLSVCVYVVSIAICVWCVCVYVSIAICVWCVCVYVSICVCVSVMSVCVINLDSASDVLQLYKSLKFSSVTRSNLETSASPHSPPSSSVATASYSAYRWAWPTITQ